MMQNVPSFSWLREVVVPVVFILFGSALGFVLSQINDDRKANRAKQSFLRAIRMEMDALSDQLDGSLHAVKVSKKTVAANGNGPKFAAAFRTSVFMSQIGRVRDVDDPLVIEIVHFYSDLGVLQPIFDGLNELSAEYNRASAPSGEKDRVRTFVLSSLTELEHQMTGFGNRLKFLRDKLPPADVPAEATIWKKLTDMFRSARRGPR